MNIFDESIEEETVDQVEMPEEPTEEPAEEATKETAEETVEEATEDAAEEEQQEEKPVKKKKVKKKSSRAAELELAKEKEKVAELADKYQRLLAEFENMRNRNAKEQSRMFDVGAKAVLEKLLPVVDNFERGLNALDEEGKQDPFVQGIEKIYQQLMTTLDEIGVKPMNAKGTEFNPDFHNAVMHAEDPEMGENLVLEEFQKGYMYKDSVLRFAMVQVVN